MSELLSFTNSHVKRLRRLIGRRSARYEEGVLVLEGSVLIREAAAAGFTIESEYVAFGAVPVTDARVYHLAAGVLERVAPTKSPQPNIAIVAMPDYSDVLANSQLIIVTDRLNDPGNLGTIVRSAEAAGADAVVVTPGSVDPFNPKVVRSSAGAVLNVPVLQTAIGTVRSAGFRTVGTSSHRGSRYDTVDWKGKVAIIMGSESHGLPSAAPIDSWVTIEHRGRAESLNVAMAATLLIFEARRQREANEF